METFKIEDNDKLVQSLTGYLSALALMSGLGAMTEEQAAGALLGVLVFVDTYNKTAYSVATNYSADLDSFLELLISRAIEIGIFNEEVGEEMKGSVLGNNVDGDIEQMLSEVQKKIQEDDGSQN